MGSKDKLKYHVNVFIYLLLCRINSIKEVKEITI